MLPTPKPRRSLFLRIVWQVCRAGLVVVLAFAGAVLIGLLPVNRDFTSPAEGIEIIVYLDPAHSEIIVPIVTGVHDWSPWFSASDFQRLTGKETHVAFSWGSRDFFLNTPKWEDLRLDIALRSLLLPSATLMHVDMMESSRMNYENYHHVTIEPTAYEKLVEFIQASFVLDGSSHLGGQEPRHLPGANYNSHDAFYEATGTYSALYNCNTWTGDALEAAGVRTGCWTPFPMGILQVKE